MVSAFVFACVGGKNSKTPKLSLMADDVITQGGTGGLGSLVYIGWLILGHIYLKCARNTE